ncbi:MAG: cation transporter [Bacteroidales bacterium]|nr:cation transporter [Bacteroidales bacterium]
MSRNNEIIRTSVISIIANVVLSGFKAVVGLLANSIAIVMDSVNNLSDALSSVITILGTKLSERNPDRKHPFGYGRIEYFSAIVIAIIILIAGTTSLIESVKKIFNPTTPSYSFVTLLVVIVAIIVKLVLGQYVKHKGKQLKSDSLIASGADALFDAVITLSTLVSAIIMLLWKVNLDGIFGTLISVIIIKAGIEMLGSPISQLLGESIPADVYQTLRQEVMTHQEVNGVYDIILNYYGPDTIIGSLNISVPDTLTAREIHGLTRTISNDLAINHGMIINVGIYATPSGKYAELQENVTTVAKQIPHVLFTHAFYVYDESNCITLDVIPDDDIHDDESFRQSVSTYLHDKFPEYDFLIVIDHNYTDYESPKDE